MAGTKRQYGAIDIARYVSALLVVAIHVYPFVDMSPVFNQYFIAIVCRLAVPFFFVVSGYFFFRKIRRSETEENREKLKDYLWRIGKIYLIWTVIYLPYTIWNYASAGFSWQSIFSWVRDFFLNGSYYHLWFLPAMMLGMVIVWFLYEKRGMMFTLKVSLGLYVVGYLINIYAPYWETLPYVSILYGFFQKTLVTARDGFFFAPMFLSLGLLLAKTRRVRARAAGTAFAISMVLL
ncbi:acyltransferase family protein, partial [Faecalibaculum rodentium]